MTVSYSLRTVMPLLLLVAAVGGCAANADPSSPEFAARCNAALGVFYVDGGKGPEYDAKSKRERYWRDRVYALAGDSQQNKDSAAKLLIKTGYRMEEQHSGGNIASRNQEMKKIMDECAPYEK